MKKSRQKTFESGVLGRTNFKASHFGRGGTVYRDGEGFVETGVRLAVRLLFEKSRQKTFEFKLIIKKGWFFCLNIAD